MTLLNLRYPRSALWACAIRAAHGVAAKPSTSQLWAACAFRKAVLAVASTCKHTTSTQSSTPLTFQRQDICQSPTLSTPSRLELGQSITPLLLQLLDFAQSSVLFSVHISTQGESPTTLHLTFGQSPTPSASTFVQPPCSSDGYNQDFIQSSSTRAVSAKHSIDFLLTSQDEPPATHIPSEGQLSPSLYGPDERGRWNVYRVADKVTEGPFKGTYKVVWYGSQHGKKPTTYEPRRHLIRQGLKKAVLLVDRWVRTGRKKNFRQFARQTLPRGPVLTSSKSGLCAFEALQFACRLQGRSDAVPQSSVDEFIHVRREEKSEDLRFEATWKEIKQFAERLKNEGSPLSFKTLCTNYLKISASKVSVVKSLPLPVGFYIVATVL